MVKREARGRHLISPSAAANEPLELILQIVLPGAAIIFVTMNAEPRGARTLIAQQTQSNVSLGETSSFPSVEQRNVRPTVPTTGCCTAGSFRSTMPHQTSVEVVLSIDFR